VDQVLVLQAEHLRQIVILHAVLLELVAQGVPLAHQAPQRSDREVFHHAQIVSFLVRPEPAIDEHHDSAASIDGVCMLVQVFENVEQYLVVVFKEATIDALRLLFLNERPFDYVVAPGGVSV